MHIRELRHALRCHRLFLKSVHACCTYRLAIHRENQKPSVFLRTNYYDGFYRTPSVIPAKAGIHVLTGTYTEKKAHKKEWIPVFAGMTG
jgi:hypothetical protein